MADPDTTIRMDAQPSFEDAPPAPSPRRIASQKATIMGLSPHPVCVAGLAFDKIPTKPTLELELAYYRTLAAQAPCDAATSHGAPPVWPPCEPTEVLPLEDAAADVEVEVEAPMSSAEWAGRFVPVSVRPPAAAAPRPRRHWPWFVAAAFSGAALGAGFYLGLHYLA